LCDNEYINSSAVNYFYQDIGYNPKSSMVVSGISFDDKIVHQAIKDNKDRQSIKEDQKMTEEDKAFYKSISDSIGAIAKGVETNTAALAGLVKTEDKENKTEPTAAAVDLSPILDKLEELSKKLENEDAKGEQAENTDTPSIESIQKTLDSLVSRLEDIENRAKQTAKPVVGPRYIA
jgi:hypothetical protein